ncbi:MAG: hypothetical protein P1U36_01245 [Legionellaceae bacterium]|nr:hypothetical protein [Legionellaceae bacterium]
MPHMIAYFANSQKATREDYDRAVDLAPIFAEAISETVPYDVYNLLYAKIQTTFSKATSLKFTVENFKQHHGLDNLLDEYEAMARVVRALTQIMKNRKVLVELSEPTAMNTLYDALQRVLITQNNIFVPVKLTSSLVPVTPFFHPFEAYFLGQTTSSFHDRPVLTWIFSASVHISELKLAITHVSKPLVLVFVGSQYDDTNVRTQVLNQALDLIQTQKHQHMIDVLLITDKSQNTSIVDLIPKVITQDEDYTRLPDNIGYYLSHPSIQAAIYRNYQTHNVTRPIPTSVTIDDKSNAPKGYIIKHEPTDLLRASKKLTSQDLKSTLTLDINHQLTMDHDLNEEHEVHEDVSTDQEVQSQQQLNSQVQNNTESASWLWDSTWYKDTFIEQLKKRAQRHHDTKALHEFYVTSHHRQTNVWQTILNDSDDQLVNSIANTIFSHTNRASLYGRSIGSIQSQVGQSILDHLDYFLDGLDPNESCLSSFKERAWAEQYLKPATAAIYAPLVAQPLLTLLPNASLGMSALAIIAATAQASNGVVVNWALSNILKARCLTRLTFEKNDAYDSKMTFPMSIIHDYPCRYEVLLRSEDMAVLDPDVRQDLMGAAQALLDVFSKAPESFRTQDFSNLCDAYLQLVEFLCPSKEKERAILKQFLITIFLEPYEAHSGVDVFKILLSVILQGHAEGLEQFLDDVLFLHDRALLDHFYQIYFKQAQDIFSVANFNHRNTVYSHHFDVTRDITKGNAGLSTRTTPLFVETALDTPSCTSSKAWPPFQTFVHHFILFASSNNMPITHLRLSDMRTFWDRIYAKIDAYTEHHHDETRALIQTTLKHLVTKTGFSLAPLACSKTFFSGFEQLVDHAIAHRTLSEQMKLLRGLSFGYNDVPYALSHDKFQVVSATMALTLPFLNPTPTNEKKTLHTSGGMGYSITQKDLEAILEASHTEHQLIVIFRYLGKESLRESIEFYQDMLSYRGPKFFSQIAILRQGDKLKTGIKAYCKILLLGHYVLNYTGLNYQQQIDRDAFTIKFLAFIEGKKYADPQTKNSIHLSLENIETHYKDLIDTCLNDFFDYLDEAKLSHQNSGALTIFKYCDLNRITTIPPVFKLKFETRHFERFLIFNQADLKQEQHLFEHDPALLKRLMADQWKIMHEGVPTERYKLTWILFNIIYPDLTLDILLTDCLKIKLFMEKSNALLSQTHATKSYVILNRLTHKNPSIDVVLFLFDLLNHADGISFLKLLNTHAPHVLSVLSTEKYLLEKTHAIWLETPQDPNIEKLLLLCEKLIDTEEKQAVMIFDTLIQQLYLPNQMRLFDRCLNLSDEYLNQLSCLMIAHQLPLDCIDYLLEHHVDLQALHDGLNEVNQDTRAYVITVIISLLKQNIALTDALTILARCSVSQLQQLALFVHIYQCDAEVIEAIVKAPDLTVALAAYETQRFMTRLERFAYDKSLVMHKISQVKQKSWQEEDEDYNLDPDVQYTLMKDFENMMAYMLTTPVLDQYTVHQLSMQQMQLVVQKIKTELNNTELSDTQQQAYRLMLLALCCEAIYRTTGYFPRDIQIICVLNTLRRTEHMINEVQTGEGKSMITAMLGVVGSIDQTVDFATENEQLVRDGLHAFQPLYLYLGIACGGEMIQAKSPKEAYIKHGINASTPADFSFFRVFKALRNEDLPKHTLLLCDEIHVALTTSVQYRLAAVLNHLYLDIDSWRIVYAELLAFVQEKELYLDNACDAHDDVENFKYYLEIQGRPKKLLSFVNKIPYDVLTMLLDSARMPDILEENIDFLPIVKTRSSYAAPILDSGTKRPQPNISYGRFVQWLLHEHLNTQSQTNDSYPIQPHADTVMTLSAKNFFDYYIKNGGRIVGLTGTAGGAIELKEFYHQFGLRAYAYPTFYTHRIQDLGLVAAPGIVEQQQAVINFIKTHKNTAPTQPILILTDSPKAMLALAAQLKQHWCVREYTGYASGHLNEQAIVKAAGEPAQITVTTPSLGIGTDIRPAGEETLLVINCATNITADELRQFRGRTGRNGKPGQFISIIDQEALLPSDASNIKLCYAQHQKHVALAQQQARLKPRTWEITHHLAIQKLMELKSSAERLLEPQNGIGYSLIDQTCFYKTIHAFSESSEKQYAELNNEQYLIALAQAYQDILDAWLANNHDERTQPVEMLVELQHLEVFRDNHTLQASELTALSDILSLLWKTIGHQGMRQHLIMTDQWSATFEPYFKKEQSFMTSALNILSIYHMFDNLDAYHLEAQNSLHACTTFLKDIPYSHWFLQTEDLNTYALEYLSNIKSIFEDKRWDDLALPDLEDARIKTCITNFNRLMRFLSVTNQANRYGGYLVLGPVQIVINLMIMPVIKAVILKFAKKACAHSNSDYLQVLASIDDIMKILSWFVENLFNQGFERMTIDQCLEKIEPLVDNAGLIKLLEKYSQDEAAFTQTMTSIKLFISILQPHRDKPLSSVIQSDIIVDFLMSFMQGDGIKTLVPHVDLTLFREKIGKLSPRLIDTFKAFSIQSIYGLVKCLAHPECFKFLSQLPDEIACAEILNLLNEKQHPAVVTLNHFQLNHERKAAHQAEAYKQLKTSFTITTSQLEHEVISSTHMQPTDSFRAEVAPSFWITHASALEYAQKLITGFVGLLLLNLLFFHMAITTVLIGFATVVACELASTAYYSYQNNTTSAETPAISEHQLTFFTVPNSDVESTIKGESIADEVNSTCANTT